MKSKESLILLFMSSSSGFGDRINWQIRLTATGNFSTVLVDTWPKNSLSTWVRNFLISSNLSVETTSLGGGGNGGFLKI
jgi:hypothetical protein